MLKNTFCHIPKISLKSEAQLWEQGICSWDDLSNDALKHLPENKKNKLRHYIQESSLVLNDFSADYFMQNLPKQQHWRVFPNFRHACAYLDIETSGLNSTAAYITTISLYDGDLVKCFIRGKNLDNFVEEIKRYKLIVTYNGKCFDVPFIETYFKIKLDVPHIDLRYVLHNLGYKGGLKGCEHQLGISRDDLEGVDGYFAVLLWQDYVVNKNPKALDTLLAYNIADVVNLEKLMVIAYNLNLKNTPFHPELTLSEPSAPEIPYQADMATIRRIKQKYHFY